MPPSPTKIGIISTRDADGNEHHHHVLTFNASSIVQQIPKADLTTIKDNDVLSLSAYFQEITFRKSDQKPTTTTATTPRRLNPSKSLVAATKPSSVPNRTSTTAKDHKRQERNTLAISELADIDTTVNTYTSNVKSRGNYTEGTGALLASLSDSTKKLRASTPMSPRKRNATNHHTQNQKVYHHTRPEKPVESYQITENIFKLAQKQKVTKQGTSKSKLARQRFKDALATLRHRKGSTASSTAQNEQQRNIFQATRPSNSYHRSQNYSPRHTIHQQKQHNLHRHIVKSNLARKRVKHGQTMKSAADMHNQDNQDYQDNQDNQDTSPTSTFLTTTSRRSPRRQNKAAEMLNATTQAAIAADMRLKKRTWSLNKTRKRGKTRGRGKTRASSITVVGDRNVGFHKFVPGSKKDANQGGQFLMLHRHSTNRTRKDTTAGGKDGLPENKLHWKTVGAGPKARAAALQTERLQQIAEAFEKNVDVHSLAKARGAKHHEFAKLKLWKDLIGAIRMASAVGNFSETNKNINCREQVMEAVERSSQVLHTWQKGFRTLHKTHDSRLQNALTVRDLHREEMNTTEHMGYILTHVESTCGGRKKNGSEILKNKNKNKNKNKTTALVNSIQTGKTTIDMLDNEVDVWQSDHDAVPEVIQNGTLTSFWTETRIERITKEEVKTLGPEMVQFWHRFCLTRANLPGTVAPGEIALVRGIKALLEDGKTITEQVVHETMVTLDKNTYSKHPRIQKLIKVLTKQTEDGMAAS